jgi:vacuolar-type H+-ATPase subunit E/Vma4
MGRQELEAALRREGEERARQIWTEAEVRVREERDALVRQLAVEKQAETSRMASREAAALEQAYVKARRASSLERLEAEQQLAQRLWQLALATLPELQDDTGKVFRRLANELPDGPWERVEVHPRDLPAARAILPQAELSEREELIGGLIAHTRDGRIVVINTLTRRLEQAWSELLPQILSELRLGGVDGTVA